MHPLRIAAVVVVVALLSGAAARQSAGAAVPGTNGKIAFRSFRDGNSEIYVMNADGSAQTRITNNPASDADPVWSPDGRRIAFTRTAGVAVDVYVMNADGSGQTQLTTAAGNDSQPTWSPDNQRIAFTSARDGNSEIYVMNADGGGQRRLTTDPSTDQFPAWSPDGTRIAFDSNRTGAGDVYVMNADGTAPTPLTSAPQFVFNAEPTWSPDGRRLAFESNRDNVGTSGFFNGAEIYVMNADGSGQTRLTTDGVSDEDPAWSPDGRFIAFDHVNSTDKVHTDRGADILVMNADGSGRRPLTGPAPTADGQPDWETLAGDCPDVPVGHAIAHGCFKETTPGSGVFTTDQKAWVGGFQIEPRPGGTLVVDTHAPGIREEGAGVDMVFAGFKVPVPVSLLPVGVPAGTISLGQAGTLSKVLLDLPVKGELTVAWADGGTSASLDAKVDVESLTAAVGKLVALRPGENVNDVGGKFSGKLVNGQGAVLSSMEVKIDKIDVVPAKLRVPRTLGLRNLLLRLETKNGKPLWTGQAGIALPLTRGELDITGRVFVFDGSIAGGGLSADGINKPIGGTPIVLQKVEGDLLFAPEWGINVGVGATFGPKVNGVALQTIDGSMKSGPLAADCTSGDDPALLSFESELNPLKSLTNAGLAKAKVSGTSCTYVSANPAIEVTVSAAIDFLDNAVAYKGTQTGFVSTHGANLEGSVLLRLPALPELNGQAILSTRGIAACTNVGFFDGGFGYRWGDRAPTTFGGCDLSPFRVTATARAAAAGGARSVRVPAALPFVGFAATSPAGPPRVRVSGPGGVTVVTSDRARRSATVVVVPDAANRTTYVFVKRPHAGTWHVGSASPLTSVAVARGLPKPHVTARVRGKGARRVLSYSVAPLHGQQVRFIERGAGVAHELGRARGRRGRIVFKATVTGNRRRTIVAEVIQNGLPRANLTVARFRAPARPKLVKPRLMAKRTKSTLTLSWKPVPGATRYLVEVDSGRTLVQRLLTRKRKVTFGGTPATGALTVTVRALGANVPPGPVTKAVYGRK